jgi:hypothetical protein
MKLFCITILLLACTNTFSQNRTEEYTITLPEQKVQHSLYKTIRFMDSRDDTTNMGIVQVGAFNKKVRVMPESAFGDQLTSVLNALNDTDAGNGELLFQLRQFSFAEITGAMSEKGYCYLRSSLYTHEGDRYRKLGEIDTVILIKSMDVTRSLFRKGSKTITDFIAAHLAVSPAAAESYAYDDVVHISDIEKRTINVYNAAVYTDGVYKTFETFKNQVPDYTGITVGFRDGILSSVTALDENGKKIKIKAKEIYAVVHGGGPFIATDYGYYPLIKRDNDFFFTGKAKVQASTGDMIAAGVFFGILGSLVAADAANAVFEMKVDHLNGGFIRIKEIPQ